MSRLPLLWQMLIRNAVATIVVCVAFGLVAYAALYRYMLASVDHDLYAEALEVAKLIEQTGTPRALSTTELGRAEDASLVAEQLAVKVFSAKARLLDHSHNAVGVDVSPPQWMIEYVHAGQPVYGHIAAAGGKRLRAILLPRMQAGRLRLMIFAFVSLQPVERALESFSRGLLAVVPVLTLIVLAASWVSARASLAPLKTLAGHLASIDTSSLDKPVALRGTGDELDQVVAAFNALMAKLARAFDHLGQFANQAAHQLRTPLAVLRGEIELALEGRRDAEAYRTALQRAAREVARLERLVNSLLLLSKLERHQLAGELVELDALLRDLVHVGPSGDCRIELHAPPVPLVTLGDRQLIEQMILNILDNACRYGGDTVMVSAQRRDGDVVVTIADNGPGMSPEELKQVGTPFFRGREGRRHDGSGLGLALSLRIAQALGGSLSLACPPEGGTVATIILPAADDLDEP